MVDLAGKRSGNFYMTKTAAVLAIALAAVPCPAQVIRDSMQAVGGGGRYTRISIEDPKPKDPAPPQKLRANMRYLTPGTVLAKQTIDGKTWIQMDVKRQDITGQIWVADHPQADKIGVLQAVPCVVVLGPSIEQLQGRQAAYWFADGYYEYPAFRAFAMRRPGVPVE